MAEVEDQSDSIESGESNAEEDVLGDPEEAEHLFNVLNSFLAYRRTAHYSVTHVRRQSFYSLPSAQWILLATPKFGILDHFNAIDDAIDANARIAEACLSSALPSFGLPEWNSSHTDPPVWAKSSNSNDQGKAYQTIRQLYRDWSEEGKVERERCYDPVLNALDQVFSTTPRSKRGEIKVLVPGAGLGRLLFEIVRNGYSAEGNEISYHQVVVSNHMLNHVQRAQQYDLYPWALGFSNHLSRTDQLHCVKIPDLHPGQALLEASIDIEIPLEDRMSMCSGDFCEVYMRSKYEDSFDAVTTVFFIDTAPNFLKYIETVRNCLRTGGYWINLGPLLWHFESSAAAAPSNNQVDDQVNELQKANEDATLDGSNTTSAKLHTESEDSGIGAKGSVEFTEAEVVALLDHFGFVIERHEVRMESTGYIQNPESMLQSLYRPSFWVARKI